MRKIFCLALAAFCTLSGAAVNGTLKDGNGKPISGALVVAEGTDQAALTDANGHFQLGAIQAGIIPQFRSTLPQKGLRIDAQGRIQRATGTFPQRIYFRRPAGRSREAALSARIAAVVNGSLLISHAGQFSQIDGIDVNDSSPLAFNLEIISEFEKTSEVTREVADVKILAMTDSTMLGVDPASNAHPVCQGGKVKFLPDTSTMKYRITGKTLYEWDPIDGETGEDAASLLASYTGTKLGTWNMSGLGRIPVKLPDSVDQAMVDSAIDLQKRVARISGTQTIANDKVHFDMAFGFCMGPLLASMLTTEPLSGTAKSCTEVELHNGPETAVWGFKVANGKSTNTFRYHDTTCTSESPSDTGPAYDCKDEPDGTVPVDTSDHDASDGLSGFANCPGFISFFTGGIDIPDGLPGGMLPGDLIPKSPASLPLSKAAVPRVPNPISLERNFRSRVFRHARFGR